MSGKRSMVKTKIKDKKQKIKDKSNKTKVFEFIQLNGIIQLVILFCH
jgi:hypothetical protein